MKMMRITGPAITVIKKRNTAKDIYLSGNPPLNPHAIPVLYKMVDR